MSGKVEIPLAIRNRLLCDCSSPTKPSPYASPAEVVAWLVEHTVGVDPPWEPSEALVQRYIRARWADGILCADRLAIEQLEAAHAAGMVEGTPWLSRDEIERICCEELQGAGILYPSRYARMCADALTESRKP